MTHRTSAAMPPTSPVNAGRTMSAQLVSDAERRAAVSELRRHTTSGRLTLDEFDARAGEVYDARSSADLVAALRDLPVLRESAVSAHGSGLLAHPTVPDHCALAGRHKGRTFGAHLISYMSIMALLIGIWVLTTPGGYFWPVWPALGWGVGLFAHGASALTGHGAGDRPQR